MEWLGPKEDEDVPEEVTSAGAAHSRNLQRDCEYSKILFQVFEGKKKRHKEQNTGNGSSLRKECYQSPSAEAALSLGLAMCLRKAGLGLSAFWRFFLRERETKSLLSIF